MIMIALLASGDSKEYQICSSIRITSRSYNPVNISRTGQRMAEKNFLSGVDPAVRRSTYFQRALKIPR